MLIGMAFSTQHTNQHVGLCGCQNPAYKKQHQIKSLTSNALK
jgi:hypothetical protein